MVVIHGDCDERFKSVKEAFKRNFEEDLEVGASLAITHKGKLVVDLWGGYMDAKKSRPWEKDTIVNVYSTTKVMGALCVHILVDRGLIDLDAPVSNYWPEFAQAGKKDIPVRYILSHTTGIPGFNEKICVNDLYNWEKMTAMVASQKPWWKPGTRSGYQSISFSFLVGELVRRILLQSGDSSKTIGEFFRNEVAKPLNIDFHIGLNSKHDERVANLILEKASSMRLTAGRAPAGIAAACVYISSHVCNDEVTQGAIALAAGVTEVTVRNRYKELVRELDIELSI
jgi:CubicO group peptidase (beta-lactamase class C family)